MSLETLNKKFNKLLKNKIEINNSDDVFKALEENNAELRYTAIKSPYFGPEHMDKALSDKDSRVRRAAYKSPHFGPEHIDKMLNDEDDDNRGLILVSKHFGPEHMDKILNDKNEQIRYAAVLSPNFREQHFDKAFNDKSGMVREGATRSPYFNKQHMDKALNDNDIYVRRNAILSSNFGPEYIDKALSDEDVGNRIQVTSSPHFGPEHFGKAIHDEDRDVRLATINSPTFGPEHMDKYIDHLHSKYLEDEQSLSSRPIRPLPVRRTLTKEEYGNYLKLHKHEKNNPSRPDISNFKYKGPDALWVSMQKDADKGEDTNLTGEMCVTPFGEKEDLFRENKGHLGYVFRGKPSYFFPFDAYSSVDKETGKRKMERLENDHPNTNQKEAWLEPHKSEHVGTIHVSESPNLDHFLQNDKQGISLARDTHTQGLRHWTRFSSGKQMEIKPEHLETDGEIKIKKSLDQQFKELLEKLSNNHLSKGNPDK